MDYSKNAVSRFFMDEIKYLPVEEKFLMLVSTVYRFILYGRDEIIQSCLDGNFN